MRSPLIVCGILIAGCGGTPDTAAKNRTFYDWSVASAGGTSAGQFEQRYPPLDLAAKEPSPEFIGVTVVRAGVHLSRPRNWLIREAGNEPGRSFIQYTSPKAYSFGIYERPESPKETWHDVLNRYEDDVASVGAKVVGRRVPVATAIGQGRAYTVERSVEAAKRPFTSRSREILLRGDHRIVIVQVVYQGENLSAVDDELLRVIGTLEVL